MKHDSFLSRDDASVFAETTDGSPPVEHLTVQLEAAAAVVLADVPYFCCMLSPDIERTSTCRGPADLWRVEASLI